MDNSGIADIFSLLSKLMDVHGENSFKSKSYANTAFQLEKITEPLAELSLEQLSKLKGVGDSAAKKILEIISTGTLVILNDLIEKTPDGVIEMLSLKGLGPKKINTIWKEMEIESIGEILYACNENRLTLFKGFGAKTQQNIKETIEFYLRHQGSMLYSQAAVFAANILQHLQKLVAPADIFIVGGVAMHDDTINVINFITDENVDNIKKVFDQSGMEWKEEGDSSVSFQPEEGARVMIDCVAGSVMKQRVFERNCSADFLQSFGEKYVVEHINQHPSEAAYFEALEIDYIQPHLRHNPSIIPMAAKRALPSIIEKTDIKGIIHSHSNWSDGSFSLEQMAESAMKKGFEYLVISDHSKSAFYANGLTEERIAAQHQQVEELNAKLAPFKIFKSIESDILNDGSLDYSNAILSTFDLVIGSVHSNLKMSQDKAMLRLITAISNPYTTILGHMTGRLLLSRNGYPVEHKMIIDCCVENEVVIEINAHPRRLDIDWRWIAYALEKGALLSIDPDAHSLDGFDDIRYGVIAAQKGLLTAAHNLSSFSLAEFESYIADRKKNKGI